MMMMMLIILPIVSWCAPSTVAANLNAANLDGIKSQFQAAMKSFSDVASLHYTLAGIKELGVQPPDSYCNEIKKLVDKSNVESIYHATEAARTITNCKVYSSLSLSAKNKLLFHSTASLYFSYLLKIIVQL